MTDATKDATGTTRPRRRAAVAAALIGAGALLAAPRAEALPDLVIVEEDSLLEFVSCERGQPLARGRISIKNVGETTSRGRLGVLTRVARSLLAVYVPEHLDLMDTGTNTAALDPNEQATISVTVGRGQLKAGRFLGGLAELPEGVDDSEELDETALTSGEIREIQRALRDGGYYRGLIDGLFSETVVNAVADFQLSLGDAATGRLTLSQTSVLADQTGRPLSIITAEGAESQVARRVPVTLYAVVDPYNVVAESDESNNFVRFTGEIVCR